MNLTKNQTVMAAIGAVALIASGVLGYMVFSAVSAKSLTEGELEGAVSSVRRLYGSEIIPEKDSVNAVKANGNAVSSWREAAIDTAAAGDIAISADVNEASFKQKMVDDARIMAKYKGAVAGAIVAPDFAFGFKEFITGSELPERSRLPRLQRQWADIGIIVSLLADSGIDEITAIAPVQEQVKKVEEDKPKSRRRNRRVQKKTEEEKPAFTKETYEIAFRARPAALVKTVNALVADERFIVIDTFSFERDKDLISAAIVEDKKDASPSRRSRRRGRAREEADENKDEAAEAVKKGPITDPTLEGPFTVKMTLTTYDFGTAGGGAAPKAEETTAKEDE